MSKWDYIARLRSVGKMTDVTNFTWHCQWAGCTEQPAKGIFCAPHAEAFLKKTEAMKQMDKRTKASGRDVKIPIVTLGVLQGLSGEAVKRYLQLRMDYKCERPVQLPADEALVELNEAGLVWVGSQPNRKHEVAARVMKMPQKGRMD